MANIRKSFNFRSGLQVDNDNFVINANGLVGIGTSVPSQYLLNVYGDTRTTGLTTTRDLYAQNVEISGISTVGFITATTSYIGILTVSQIKVGNVDVTGIITATTFSGNVNSGISTFTELKVGTAITMSAGIVTATSFVGNLTGVVTGDVTGTATTATNLSDGANITTGTISDARLPDLITSNINASSGVSTFNNIKQSNNAYAAFATNDVQGFDAIGGNALRFVINPPTLPSGSGSPRVVVTQKGCIGSGTTNPQCALDLGSATANDDGESYSSDRFMILPKVSTSNRGNLNNLTAGALIYNTSLNKIQVYTGSGWESTLHINVKDFGAKGDGSTDDYTAITNAIAASAGKTLIFPKGTYSVTQTIVFDQSDCIVRGEGGVTITMPNTVNRTWSVANVGKSTIGSANAISPVERVLIENITFEFNNNRRTVTSGTGSNKDDAYEKNACTVANAKYITLRNCRFLNGWRHCLDISTPIKKSTGSLTAAQKLAQMPVLPNISGTEIFGAQYITIDGCYFKGGGDDNLTTHYCSDVLIINCWSESPYGGYDVGSGNHNGYEIDDGSRNITLSNSTAFKCMSGIEIKAHDYAPAPYNVMIDTVRIINCSSAIEIHHTNWEGPVTGNNDNAWNVLFVPNSLTTVTLAAGTPQEVVCTNGISPVARNVSVSNVQIIAPTTITYFVRDASNNYTTATIAPNRCFEVGGYDGVLVSNITFNDGRRDLALSDVDGYSQPVVFSGNIGLIHLHDGCRNVSFSNVQVTGFGGSTPLTSRVFEIVSNCFDAINCSNLTVVDGPNQLVEATGSNQAYFGAFRGVVARSTVNMAGPALDSSNYNLRFEQPDITGYTDTIDVQEVVLEKSSGTPGDGRGVGSVHVDTNTGVLRTKTTSRSSSDWTSLGALAWARYTGSNDTIRKSNNIESIVRNSTGDYTVTLSDDLIFNSSNDFCVTVTSSQPLVKVVSPSIDGNGHASFEVQLFDASNTPQDSGFINIIVFGETLAS